MRQISEGSRRPFCCASASNLTSPETTPETGDLDLGMSCRTSPQRHVAMETSKEVDLHSLKHDLDTNNRSLSTTRICPLIRRPVYNLVTRVQLRVLFASYRGRAMWQQFPTLYRHVPQIAVLTCATAILASIASSHGMFSCGVQSINT